MKHRNIYQEFNQSRMSAWGPKMNKDDLSQQKLDSIHNKLTEINHNMLKVFWIVAMFALLYFGLMIYLLFLR